MGFLVGVWFTEHICTESSTWGKFSVISNSARCSSVRANPFSFVSEICLPLYCWWSSFVSRCGLLLFSTLDENWFRSSWISLDLRLSNSLLYERLSSTLWESSERTWKGKQYFYISFEKKSGTNFIYTNCSNEDKRDFFSLLVTCYYKQKIYFFIYT